MKNIHLILILVLGLFSTQGWAPPIKGGATGGSATGQDISKCDLNPSKQTKVKIKGKDGKEHFICTGQAACAGKTVPVSCKVSEREPCPTAKQCIVYEEEVQFDLQIACSNMPKDKRCVKDIRAFIKFEENGGKCSSSGRQYWRIFNKSDKNNIEVQVDYYWNNRGSPEQAANRPKCFSIPPGKNSKLECAELEAGVPQYINYYNYSPPDKYSVIWGYFNGCKE